MNSCRLLGRVVFFVGAGLAAAASMIGTKRSPGAEILSPINAKLSMRGEAQFACGAIERCIFGFGFLGVMLAITK